MRTILHSDCNNFYASVETVLNPSLRGKPLAVCGSEDQRHGIVLAKNELAKACGIKTGDVIWQARQKCPTLTVIEPHAGVYWDFAQKVRTIYYDYTDQIEPFGLDECWLDVTGSPGSGEEIAAQIRRRVKNELGITVSIGVSFNKVFAKLASDMRKPDATTLITPQNYQQKVWPLPVGDLLFVGRATRQALNNCGMYTIGDIARAPQAVLTRQFGKGGETLYAYANGWDDAPVLLLGEGEALKSVGNSTTLARNVVTLEEAKTVLYMLSDSVATRLREDHFLCRTVTLWVRDHTLASYEKQAPLPAPSNLCEDLCKCAYTLFERTWDGHTPIRSLGVRTTMLLPREGDLQQNLLQDEHHARMEHLAITIDTLRGRFGQNAITRALLLKAHGLTDGRLITAPEQMVYES